MKITLTGSIGHIGRPLTEKLVAQGHTVTVISSNSVRSKEISALGAIPAIGKLQDTDFLASTFKGSDLVYTLVPPANYFDRKLDLLEYFIELGNGFADALRQTEVERVVNLSSIGAHLEKGSGILEGTYQVENILNNLPDDVAVTHVRPVEIYYNLFQYIERIKSEGVMSGNLAEDNINVWVSLEDIANSVVEEINSPSIGRKVQYVAGEEVTYKELASTLGSAIGKPDLKWVQITDDQLRDRLIHVGMQPKMTEKMTEMYAAIRSGLLYEHYNQNKPRTFGEVKLENFAEDFAAAYKKA
ncbi:MAG: NAD(P)H-binding protein [Bacteroidota bacterium]